VIAVPDFADVAFGFLFAIGALPYAVATLPLLPFFLFVGI
jgi:hypothetical protein